MNYAQQMNVLRSSFIILLSLSLKIYCSGVPKQINFIITKYSSFWKTYPFFQLSSEKIYDIYIQQKHFTLFHFDIFIRLTLITEFKFYWCSPRIKSYSHTHRTTSMIRWKEKDLAKKKKIYIYETRKKKYTYRTTVKSTKEKKKRKKVLYISYKTREGRRVEFEGLLTPFFPNNNITKLIL